MGKESILSGKDLIVFEKRRDVLPETPRRFGGNAETVFGWVFLTILVNMGFEPYKAVHADGTSL